MQLNKRIERWLRLRKKLRAQIIETHSSERLQTLVKRLHAVNRDQRDTMRGLTHSNLEHSGIALSEVIAGIKLNSLPRIKQKPW